MRVGLVGAGAIGRYVGGKLLASGIDLVFDRRTAAGPIQIAELGGATRAEIAAERVVTGGFDDREAVLVCVKSSATADVGKLLAGELSRDCIVVSLQNGLHNAEILRRALPDHAVLGGIVGFNVVRRDPIVQRTTSGPLAIERGNGPRFDALVAGLRGAGLAVQTPADIVPHQYTKLLVNLGNAVSALSDAPTRELMLSRGYRRILADLIGEALRVLRAAGIKPARLRGLPVRIVPTMMRLPTPIVKLVARAQLGIDPEARSSMHDDLTRGRLTEIEELNGEIVRLAERAGIEAPRNRKIVALVHAAEDAAAGSPKLDAEALAAALA